MRFAAMLEQTDDEIADEIELELSENPALEKVDEPDNEPRYYTPRAINHNEPTLQRGGAGAGSGV